MNTFGQHLLVEYRGCDPAVLDDIDRIEALMRRAAEVANATVVAAAFHRFAPQGVSGVVVVEESHLSIHTWPERGYAAVDFYTCGDGMPERAHAFLRDHLRADSAELMSVRRGMGPTGRSMRVDRHHSEHVAHDHRAQPKDAARRDSALRDITRRDIARRDAPRRDAAVPEPRRDGAGEPSRDNVRDNARDDGHGQVALQEQ